MTYRELKDALMWLTPEELEQQVQILPPCADGDRKIGLHSVVGIDTARNYLGDNECRSAVDNKHHPEQWVLLSDWNPFSEDGDSSYALQEDGTFTGNVTGKTIDFYTT